MTIAEAILRDFEAETLFSRKVLEAVPADQYDWKPDEKSMSLGQLAGHIAEAPAWVTSMGTDNFDFSEIAGEYVPFVPSSSEELLGALDTNAAAFAEFLEGRDDEFMSSMWSMSAGGETIMTSPRDAAIRSVLIHHVSHHRGQLTVYLRMLGVGVPRTYGPTADYPDSP